MGIGVSLWTLDEPLLTGQLLEWRDLSVAYDRHHLHSTDGGSCLVWLFVKPASPLPWHW